VAPGGGALTLGFSGGVGMRSAGILGGPVIGYEQDYAATSQVKQVAPQNYAGYKADKPTSPLPALPEVAGLDNGKVGVLDDYMGIQRRMEEASMVKPCRVERLNAAITRPRPSTPSWSRSLQKPDGEPARVVDPATKQEYVLLTLADYQELLQGTYDDSPWTDKEMDLLAAEVDAMLDDDMAIEDPRQ
jgi:hypothetical protein